MGNEQEYQEKLALIGELSRDDALIVSRMYKSNSYDEVRALRRLRAVLLAWREQLGAWND